MTNGKPTKPKPKPFGDLLDKVVKPGGRVNRSALDALIGRIAEISPDPLNASQTRRIIELFGMVIFTDVALTEEKKEGSSAATFGDLLGSLSYAPSTLDSVCGTIVSQLCTRLSYTGKNGTFPSRHCPIRIEAILAVLERISPTRDSRKRCAILLVCNLCRPVNHPETVSELAKTIAGLIGEIERHAPSLLVRERRHCFFKSLVEHLLMDERDPTNPVLFGGTKFVQTLSSLLGDVIPFKAFNEGMVCRVKHHIPEVTDESKARALAELLAEMGCEGAQIFGQGFIPPEELMRDALIKCNVAPAGIKPAKRKQRSGDDEEGEEGPNKKRKDTSSSSSL